jgi:pyruvate-formate lyase
MGSHVGATPDGRLSGAPLADGGVSPTAGRDRRGATAVLHSVSKINLELATNGTLLNMKFLPSFFECKHAYKNFSAFLRGFSALQIPHVQFMWSLDLLREAKRPRPFRTWGARGGYSAYFVERTIDLQNESIQRRNCECLKNKSNLLGGDPCYLTARTKSSRVRGSAVPDRQRRHLRRKIALLHQAYLQHAAEPIIIRRALALKNLPGNVTLYFDADTLIPG